jgi:hypothetical protein
MKRLPTPPLKKGDEGGFVQKILPDPPFRKEGIKNIGNSPA